MSFSAKGVSMEISKILSKNDIGLTGAHQAGVVVPHEVERLGFFPKLNYSIINPRIQLLVEVAQTGEELNLNYIYYNGRLHGTSTRNEYRLTGISGFLRRCGATQGDVLTFIKRSTGQIVLNLTGAGHQVPLGEEQIRISISSWTLKGVKP